MSHNSPVVVLHVGAMKTGTTYLQHKLIANREALAEAGVDFVGRRWRDQVSAVQDLLQLNQDDVAVRRRSAGAWDRMVETIRGSSGRTALMSMEFLSFARKPHAQRAVDSLAGLDVHVVLTVRDTAAVVPALWQTSITSGGTMTWPRFMAGVRASATAGGWASRALGKLGVATARRFHEAIDVPRMLDVWSSVLPPERVHVVVVPGPGAPRDRLWELFSEIIDLDPAAAPAPPEAANESLGLPSAELVRRLNERLDLRRQTHQRTVKVDLAAAGLSELRHSERKARLDPATFRTAVRWNQRIRSVIAERGVAVHGDLDDLPLEPDPADYALDASQVPPTRAELLRAARRGYATLRRHNQERIAERYAGKQAKRQQRRLRQMLTGPQGWRRTDEPLETALEDLELLVRAAIRLDRQVIRQRARERERIRQRRRERRRARRRAQRSAEGPDDG